MAGVDVITYGALKKEIEKSLKGAGAIKGEKGDPGDRGLPGEKGDPGVQGEPGLTPNLMVGSVTKGEIPAVTMTKTGDADYTIDFTLIPGEKGDRGERGLQGEPGTPGERGLQGVPGRPGVDGVQGPQGVPGADGKSFSITSNYATYEELIAEHPTGNAGDAYFVGQEGKSPDVYVWEVENEKWFNNGPILGLEGPQGPPGEKGDPGEAGQPGPEGVPGQPGQPGAQGDPGADGQPGKDGVSPTITTERFDGYTSVKITDAKGTQEVKLYDGAKGEKGDPGADGRDGQPGADGTPGRDGRDGQRGATGAPGKDGRDGIDGVTLPSNTYTLNKEVVVGTWTNGKTLYRQTKHYGRIFGSSGSAKYTPLGLGVTPSFAFFGPETYIESDSGLLLSTTVFPGTNYIRASIKIADMTIEATTTASNGNSYDFTATVYYTK